MRIADSLLQKTDLKMYTTHLSGERACICVCVYVCTCVCVYVRASVCVCVCTFCAEPRAGGELGNIHDLDSKLLSRVPVDASPDHAEGTPAEQAHTHTNISKYIHPNPIMHSAERIITIQNECRRLSGTAVEVNVRGQPMQQLCLLLKKSHLAMFMSHLLFSLK